MYFLELQIAILYKSFVDLGFTMINDYLPFPL